MLFSELNFKKYIMDALEELGFVKATSVQEKVFKQLKSNNNNNNIHNNRTNIHILLPKRRKKNHINNNTKLQNHPKVKTFSKGEEPYRKVVITLK